MYPSNCFGIVPNIIIRERVFVKIPSSRLYSENDVVFGNALRLFSAMSINDGHAGWYIQGTTCLPFHKGGITTYVQVVTVKALRIRPSEKDAMVIVVAFSPCFLGSCGAKRI